MSTPELYANSWTLRPKIHTEATPAHTARAAHGDGLTLSCPVCQKPHGARLVRKLIVDPIPQAQAGIRGEGRIDSRYYPPAVPVLSPKSRGPISRSTRWSLSVS